MWSLRVNNDIMAHYELFCQYQRENKHVKAKSKVAGTLLCQFQTEDVVHCGMKGKPKTSYNISKYRDIIQKTIPFIFS